MVDSRVHLFISGMVQGVGFRYFAMRKAAAYEIKGFAKNLFDGRVEVVAEGEKGLLEEFIRDVRRGPISAHVTDIRVEWEKPSFEFNRFEAL